jgi:hypothetical protein
VVRDFIAEHHGTSLVEYFYAAARKQSDATHLVQEESFRYPGPKPRTREAGIALLADSVEAASRALDEPTAPRLEDLIREIIMKKLNDGQLDECPLTMRELRQIEKCFLKVLVSAYHTRVKYPEKSETERRNSAGR